MQNKTYRPTQAVLDNIQRGIVLRDKYNRHSAISENSKVKVQKAKETLRPDDTGSLTFDAVKLMYNELVKLEKSVDFIARAYDGGPNDNLITWYAHGGTAGLAWCRSVLKAEGILKSYTKDISKEETELQEKDQVGKVKVTKGISEELMQVTFIAMKADSTDLHGDATSKDEVRKAKESFNKAWVKGQKLENLYHITSTDSFTILESYLAPCDMILKGNLVLEGDWLMTLQINDASLWELVKSGEINGISIGALAAVEVIDE